ncbi:hypothetical protein BC831DRAFT_452160 [Entophlyctis helioformis]|nr:hypothetical protein BC831DRAFT_452160 [Entophlyctis helioformis]
MATFNTVSVDDGAGAGQHRKTASGTRATSSRHAAIEAPAATPATAAAAANRRQPLSLVRMSLVLSALFVAAVAAAPPSIGSTAAAIRPVHGTGSQPHPQPLPQSPSPSLFQPLQSQSPPAKRFAATRAATAAWATLETLSYVTADASGVDGTVGGESSTGSSGGSGSPPKKIKQNQGIIVPLMTFMSIGLACFLIFCVVRTLFLDIYSPRRVLSRGRPPRLRKGLFSWIPVVYRTKEAFLINTVGLDGVMLLRFFKMGYTMFAVFSVLGLGILAPVNYYAHPPPGIANATGYKLEDLLLPSLSVDNVPNKSQYLRVHMAFTWIFSLMTIGYVVSYYRGYVLLKLQYDEHALRQTKMSKIDMRSIMVFGIPREMRNEVDLASYFENLGIGHVENVVLCRNWSLLRTHIQRRAYFLGQLERVYALAIRRRDARQRHSVFAPLLACLAGACSLCGLNLGGSRRPDRTATARSADAPLNRQRSWRIMGSSARFLSSMSHEHQPLLSQHLRFASAEVTDPGAFEILSRMGALDPSLRPTHRTGFMGLFGPVVDSAEYYAEQFQEHDRQVSRLRRIPEESAPTAVGIVTFESPESATLAAQVVVQRRPFACMIKMAPEPRDIYWPNLSSKTANNYTKLVRGLSVLACLFLLVFSSTLIGSTITGLIDLDQLAVYFPMLGAILKDMPDTWRQFIQGVIPATLLAMWTSSLPSLLLFLSQAQGLEAESWIEMSLLTKYFFYQLWNVLFVTVFARTLLYEIIPNPQKVIELLGQMVPKASTPLINYVILQGTAVYPAQLLLAAPLVMTWISRLWSRSTPRQLSDAYYPSILTCINYGIAYPVPILLFVIGTVYAPIAPLVLPFCAMFFAIAYFVYKYMLMYVHLPRYESKGAAARLAVNRCLGGLVIMQLTMMGLLALKTSDDGQSLGAQSVMQAPIHTTDGGDPTPWSDYAHMVIGVLPLLFITAFVYRWLNQGYEKQVTNIPLEILGKVAYEMAAERMADADAGSPLYGVPGGNASRTNHGAMVNPVGRTHGVVGIAHHGNGRTAGSIATNTSSAAYSSNRSQMSRELSEIGPRRQLTTTSINSERARRVSGNHHFGRQTSTDVNVEALVHQTASPIFQQQQTPLVSPTRDLHSSHLPDAPAASGSASPFAFPQSSAVAGEGQGNPSASITIPTPTVEVIVASSVEGSILSSPEYPGPNSSALHETLRRKPSSASMQTGHISMFDEELNQPSPFDPAAAAAPTPDGSEVALDGEEAHGPATLSDVEERISFGVHLEPPTTRVPGVLDAPVEAASSILRYGDEVDLEYDPMNEDLLLRTYIHPALIGKLPLAWLPGKEPPRRLTELREEQAKLQREVWQRLVAKQRLGVRVAVNDQQQQNMLHMHDGHEDELIQPTRFSGGGQDAPVFGRIRSFVDGFASWVHLTIS